MTKLGFIGVAVAAVLMLAPEAMAQRRGGGGGGAARGGMRGAVVGGMAGGSEGAKKGAKAGVAVGATRGAVNRAADRRTVDSESESRSEYESSSEYANSQHSDFAESPPDLLITSTSDKSATPGGEAILSKDGKPIVSITYPSDWKQKGTDESVSAVSKKGNAWSALALLDGVKDKQAGIKKIKQGLEKNLNDIEYDELTKTDRGALLITGTGKGKKAGADVAFAVGVFEAAPKQLAGVAFIVDKSVDDRYKEAARYIVKTIRTEKDLAGQKHEVAKPVEK
jgi:hypothetical protein